MASYIDKVNFYNEGGGLQKSVSIYSKDIVNAVKEGCDNTGSTDCGDLINSLCSKYTGYTIFFPKGRYKINTAVTVRNDGNYLGNILAGEPGTEFFTDGIPTMLTFGNGSNASTINKIGITDIFVNASNVTSVAVMVGDNQYSFYCNNLIIRNCGNIIGLKLCNDNTTSLQAYINNLVITGNGTMQGTGLRIEGTDNYLCNVNIGRMQHNINFAGGGNLCSNIHTWILDDDIITLGSKTPEEKMKYSSIIFSGSNVISDLQVDNGSPAVEFNQYAVQNTIGNASFNYQDDFPWGTDSDECKAVYVSGSGSLGNNISIKNISFQPATGNKIDLIGFHKYDGTTVYPLGIGWDVKIPKRTKAMALRFPDCSFANTIYEKTPILTTNVNVTNTSKCCLLGYIGFSNTNMASTYKFYDLRGGEVVVQMKLSGGTITSTGSIIRPFSNNVQLLIDKSVSNVNGLRVAKIYYKSNNTGAIYNSLIAEPVASPDVFNSFIPLRDYTEIALPTSYDSINLYRT